MQEIRRDIYLHQLIEKQWNGQVKVITGLRRSGKSYLLFTLFVRYLIEHDVPQDHIITLALDDFKNRQYRQAEALYDYVTERITPSGQYYVLLDEIQKAEDFVDVLNGFLHIPNIDVYVTGSNSKFLSSDIATEFGDRGDEINVHPLSFSEFFSVYDGDKHRAWNEYCRFGGMPLVLQRTTDAAKQQYLKDLFRKVYLKDIIARYSLRADNELANVTDIVASDIGSLLNPLRIANTIKTAKNKSVSQNTIEKYLDYLQDSFLIDKATRYDIKGRKYIGTQTKYYFEDVGIRNAVLNFRQSDDASHLMENVIYNELRNRGYSVDVGLVETYERNAEGKTERKNLEVDFVINRGDQRIYIQSAYSMPSQEKIQQEKRPLLNVPDNFQKIIITDGYNMTHYNADGILEIGLFDFLLDPDILN